MSVAARAKPSIGGALVLAGIALAPWAHSHRPFIEPPTIAVQTSPEPGFEAEQPRRRILLVPHEGQAWGPHYVDDNVIVPPHLRDAEPYPVGMVMGMHTPSVDPGILVWDGSPLANMLSVILAPWQALAGLTGT